MSRVYHRFVTPSVRLCSAWINSFNLTKRFRTHQLSIIDYPHSRRFVKSVSLLFCAFWIGTVHAQVQWDNLADFTDDATQGEQTSGDAPFSRAELKAAQFFRAVNDPQLQADIDQQYEQIQTLLHQGNAFNYRLAENYYGYATLLREAGRLDEAARAFVDALHVQKANYGLYDVRHRGILNALFTLNMERNQPELAEEYLQRLLLIEREADGEPDPRIAGMLVTMGLQYLDRNLLSSPGSDSALSTIDDALSYFRRALVEFSDVPISDRLPPFGEYAFASFLKQKELEFRQNTRIAETQLRPANLSLIESDLKRNGFGSVRSYENSRRAMQQFYESAISEGNQSLVVRALLSLGDVEMMFLRERAANEYYRQAWAEAQKLPMDDPNRAVLTAINVLPNFKFSSDWQRPVRPNYEKVSVPVLVSFSKIGRVKKVVADPNFELPDALISRAKRAVRRATFRPRVDDGQPVEVVSEPYRAELILRSATVDRILDRESTQSAAQEETNGQ